MAFWIGGLFYISPNIYRSYNVVTEQHLQSIIAEAIMEYSSGDGRLRLDGRTPDTSSPEAAAAAAVSSSAECHFAPFTRPTKCSCRMRLRVRLPSQKTERVARRRRWDDERRERTTRI